jgi:flagellar basal-body rod protein FlgB
MGGRKSRRFAESREAPRAGGRRLHRLAAADAARFGMPFAYPKGTKQTFAAAKPPHRPPDARSGRNGHSGGAAPDGGKNCTASENLSREAPMTHGDPTLRIINTMLDGCSHRHHVIAGNLANAETPGYKRLEVRFEDQLAEAISNGDDAAVNDVTFEVAQTDGLTQRPDGNNVDFGRELGEMSRNNLAYSTFAQLAALRIRRYRDAMGG